MLAAPPLRTVRASFPAHGSSHDEAPVGAGGKPAFSIGLVALQSTPLPDAGDADTVRCSSLLSRLGGGVTNRLVDA